MQLGELLLGGFVRLYAGAVVAAVQAALLACKTRISLASDAKWSATLDRCSQRLASILHTASDKIWAVRNGALGATGSRLSFAARALGAASGNRVRRGLPRGHQTTG